MSGVDLRKLSKKFPEDDIEWRVQQCGQGNNGPWALIIPYITSRAIMQRLDDVVGPGKWKNEFTASPCGTGYMCGISIKVDGEWVTRWDGSEKTGNGSIDQVKSTMSSAMKRTGVQWGIGRYLYQFEVQFAVAEVCDNRYKVKPGYTHQEGKIKGSNSKFGFQWKPKPLESWALPVTDLEISKTVRLLGQVKDIAELKYAWKNAYNLATSENDSEMMTKFESAKDKAKIRLSEEDQGMKDAVSERLEATIKNQLSIISFGVNESSVNGLRDVALIEVKKIASGNELAEAIKLIKGAAAQTINELRV